MAQFQMAISIILNQAQVPVPPDVLLVSHGNGTGNLHTLEVIILMVYKFFGSWFLSWRKYDGISWFVEETFIEMDLHQLILVRHMVGDCIGTALDLDNGTLVYYKNGVSQGVAASCNWYMVPIFGSLNVSFFCQLRTKTLQVPTTRWFPTIEPC